MKKRTGIITIGGEPKTLVGKPIKVGDKAPDFTVWDKDLNPVTLKDVAGKKVILTFSPSIDTSVCELQAKRFNQEAAKLDDVVIYMITRDLPFAQGRFCAAEGIDAVKMLSDYRELSFGLQYGLVVEETQLLTRGVIVIDRDGKVVYEQIVPEVSTEPDYDTALAAVKALS